MTPLASTVRARLSALLSLSVILLALGARADVETGGVYGDWGVWSDWYWPFNDTLPPNLYSTNEAMFRYDAFAGATSQTWEHDNHGPGLNQADWGGHCHAWSGASVWETMPTTSRVLGGVTFRPRDQAGLMTECYFNDTLATEISAYRPSPGLFWHYLRQEILGDNPMHGHAMSIIGNLTQTKGEVWNFPIYQYEVDYTVDTSTSTCAGSITLWFADDGNPSYADWLGMSSASLTYTFSAVSLGASGAPLDSGNWAGNDPSLYPTSLWRPYCAGTWTNYLANPQLDDAHLSQILDGLLVPCSATIATFASPSVGGSVSAGGPVNCGSSMTLCATPNPGYSFANWTENGAVVSGSSCYAFAANTDRSLVANFILGAPVLVADRVADQLVIHWATNWPGYQLEYCTNTLPPQIWDVVTPPPPTGGQYSITNPVTGPSMFYRLRHP